jgi:hypothetical protein
MENAHSIFVGNLKKERDDLGDLDLDVMIILKLFLNRM